MKDLIKKLGPGWITGASDDDPSGIGTYSYSGSRFGFGQLWTMFFTIPFMVAVQEMCARIGQVTGRGLAGVIRQHYSRRALMMCVSLLFIANTINIAADIGAMAAAFRLLVDVPFVLTAVLFTALILALEIFIPYKKYARILKFLSASLFLYVIAAVAVQKDWLNVAKHLVLPSFSFDKDYLFALVAILGTTISPYLFFWQSSTEVEEEISNGRATLKARKGVTDEEITTMRWDVGIGMVFSNLVAFFIMVTTASTLFPQGIVIETAQDAAVALTPIAGPFASLLFAIGIIGTGLLAVPILAGSASYAISEAFRWKNGLYRKWNEAYGFYAVIAIATIAGLCINFLNVDPIKLLIWTAVINGVIAPILLTLIVRIGNNKKIMGARKNSRLSSFFGWMTVALMSGSAILLLASWFV